MTTVHPRNCNRPLILFGAFDRHNFGDLLFPHVLAAMLGERELVFAGLAARDLRAFGGHRVQALPQAIAALGDDDADLVHVGGELLTCDAWQAAVMLLPPDEARHVIHRFRSESQDRQAWARRVLGVDARAPYTVQGRRLPARLGVAYCAVGGVDLQDADPALRAEVLAKLRCAKHVSVRDRHTQRQLVAEGIAALSMPDAAVMTAELFGAHIRGRAQQGEPADAARDFPRGYVAVQFSEDFGDDHTLKQLAAQLDRVAADTGCGIVLFRAGAAPWHDDLSCYRRLAGYLRATVRLFSSLDVWDICALIAGARVFAGSSLHGRIIAMAFARPRVNLVHASQTRCVTKQQAFAATWEDPAMPSVVEPALLEEGVAQALAMPPQRVSALAAELIVEYRKGFAALLAALAGS